jgi:4-hydroxy-2-oxoheptanedioate aldolase
MDNRLRNVWATESAGINAWLAMPSSVSAEVVSQHDFDSITIDLQHGLVDYTSALPMLQAMVGSDATLMARVPWLEAGVIMKMLDAGALGIICPMINTREQAEQFVGYCRYAPLGERSFGPTRAISVHGVDYPSVANDQVIALAMIETRTALLNVDSIVATPNLTGVYIGPSDLALSLGFVPKLDHDEPAVLDAIKTILAAAHSAGVKAGIHCLTPRYARSMIELGFDLVTMGSEMRALSAALTDLVTEVRTS